MGEFAQNFADLQGVMTYGQTGYSSFSNKKSWYSRITTHGTSDIYMGVYRKLFGIKTQSKPMKVFIPK